MAETKPTMTEEEALAYIEEAEQMPTEKIDRDRLADALEVLQESQDPLIRIDWRAAIRDLNFWTSPYTQGIRSYMAQSFAALGERVAQTFEYDPDTDAMPRRGPKPAATDRAQDLLARTAPVADSGSASSYDSPLFSPEARRALNQHYDVNQALMNTTLTGEEDPQSEYMFPEGVSGINVAKHIEMVTSDDYSPFPGLTREQFEMRADRAAIRFQHELNFTREDREYWRNQYAQPGGYVSGQELITWSGLSTQTRGRIEQGMVRAGLLDPDTNYVPGAFSIPQLTAMRTVMGVANYLGVGYEVALTRMGQDYQAYLRSEAKKANRGRTGSGFSRPKFSVPASLREIPDYESLAQDATNLFRQRMGRDPEDYETELMANFLQGKHRESNAKKIEAARAAFWASVSGKQGVMEVEVPDPQLRLQRDIEKRYGTEIARQERVEDQSVVNKLMIDALTTGSQMVGGEF